MDSLCAGDSKATTIKSAKTLGIWMDNYLNFKIDVNNMCKAAIVLPSDECVTYKEILRSESNTKVETYYNHHWTDRLLYS